MKFSYIIVGMHCEACVDKIRAAFSLTSFSMSAISLNPPCLQIESPTTPELTTLNSIIANAGNYSLIPLSEQAEQQQTSISEGESDKKGIWVYYPIFLITAYILGVAVLNNFQNGAMNWSGWMNQFMAGFFLVFSAFKLLDIRGFAEGYATYDLLARKWYHYGFIYPFLELGLGVLYLGGWFPILTPLLTVRIMGFSSLGVINSLLKKQKLKCACLGTILNVPLSSITLIEDLTMVCLALLVLVMR